MTALNTNPTNPAGSLQQRFVNLAGLSMAGCSFSIEDLGGPKGSPNMYICMYIYLGWTNRPCAVF